MAALQMVINYDQVIELVDQLTDEQQKQIIAHLLTHHAKQRPLTVDEKIQLLDAAKITRPVNESASIRRPALKCRAEGKQSPLKGLFFSES